MQEQRHFVRHSEQYTSCVLFSLPMASLLLTAVVVLLVANLQITRQRNRAEQEHQRAEANLLKARAAVDEYLTTVSESTLLKSSLPGLQPLRKELLQAALRYYRGFVRENQHDPDLQFELAEATFRLGLITSEIDSKDKARQLLAEARDRFQAMVDAHPSQTAYRAALGRCLIRIGYELAALRKAQPAMSAYQQGIDILENVLPARPDDDLLKADLAFGHHYLNMKQVEAGNYAKKNQHYHRAIELRQELANRHPADPRYRSDLACSMCNLAYAEYQVGELPPALDRLRKVEAVQRALVKELPWSAATQTMLSQSVQGQGEVLRSMGRKREGLQRLRESADIMDRVATQNPWDTTSRGLAARAFAQYAQLLVDSNDLELAGQALARGQAHAEAAQKASPSNLMSLATLSSIHRNRGKPLAKQGKWAPALHALRQALAVDERIAPDGVLFRYDLACSLAQCASTAAHIGDKAAAQSYADRAMVELQKAWNDGWRDLKGIEKDPDLEALRGRSDFAAFLKAARSSKSRPNP